MKRTYPTCLLLLTAVSSLLLASALIAQETEPAAAPAASTADSVAVETNRSAPADAETNATSAAATSEPAAEGSGQDWTHMQQIVLMGQDAEVKAGETVREVVVMNGNAKIHGKVLGDAVVIAGSMDLDGEVEGDTVVVMGSVRLHPGAIAHKDAVAVMGSLTVPEGATVKHDAVCVGGTLDIATNAVVGGDRVNVGLPMIFPKLEWLGKWFTQCALKMRPLAPQVGWVWGVAGVFFLLSLFIAAVFPRPVAVCVETLNRRPATTFLLGLLTQLLVPVVILILIATGIGIFIVPFVGTALFIATRIGKVAILEWIGMRLGGHFHSVFQKPVMAFVVGSIVITLFYLVPVLGLLLFLLLGVWGLGCAVTAAFSSTRRETPSKPAPLQPVPAAPAGGPPAPAAAVGPVPMQAAPPPPFNPAFAAFAPPAGLAEPPAASAAPPQMNPPPQPAAASVPPRQLATSQLMALPRAGFWERMGAGFLDIVILGILSIFVGGMPLGLIVALAYFSGMWAWKGTTLGGIVLKLQVIRSDGSPLTFPVALVRALAAALSIIVFFLGFLWIAWDPDKQAWHDKIAGTDVVCLPHSMPLVCV